MHCKPSLLVARLYRLGDAGPALRTHRTEAQHCLQTGAAKAAAAHNAHLLLHALLLLDTPSITSSSRVSLSRIYSCTRYQLESSGRM